MLLVHTPLAIVHLNTYVVPAAPLKVVVGLVFSTKLPPAPLTMLQEPVPVAGVFAANVALVPQMFWSAPAADTVGV